MPAPKTSPAAPHKLRWYQFSLRSLLVLMLLTGLGASFYQSYVREYQAQQKAALALAKNKRLSLEWREVKPAWLRYALSWTLSEEELRDVVAVHAQHAGITDDELANLRHLPKLQRLYLAGNPITDGGLQHLAGLENLRRLSLWGTKISDDGMRHLSGMKSLQVLDVHGRNKALTDKSLQHLRNLKNLRSLLFSFCVGDDGLAALAEIPLLQTHSVCVEGLTEDGLINLSRLDKVETVVVKSSSLCGDGWRHLAKLTNVKALSLQIDSFSDSELKYISKLTGLQRLSLRSTNVSNDGMWQLAGLVNLRHLDLTSTRCTADCLEHLLAMQSLESLPLDTDLDDEAVRLLARLPKLRRLAMDSYSSAHTFYLTDAGLTELPKLRLEGDLRLHDAIDGVGKRGVDVPGTSGTMTDAGFARLWKSHKFKGVSIIGRDVTLTGMRLRFDTPPFLSLTLRSSRPASEVISEPLAVGPAALELGLGYMNMTIPSNEEIGPSTVRVAWPDRSCQLALLKHLPGITRLKIDHHVGDAKLIGGWDTLRHVPLLQEFEMPGLRGEGLKIDGVGLRRIGEMKNMRKMIIRIDDSLPAEALLPLEDLKRLEELTIWCGPITAEHLRFAEGLENLRSLIIVNPRNKSNHSDGLRYLANLKQLKKLVLYGVDDEGLAEIAKIKSLDYLSVQGREITSKGLRHLESLPGISDFYLDAPLITGEEISGFHERRKKATAGQ